MPQPWDRSGARACFPAGVNAMLRKVAVAAASKPHVEIRQDGDQFYIKTSTTVRTTEINFKVGEGFEEETVDGRKCRVSPKPGSQRPAPSRAATRTRLPPCSLWRAFLAGCVRRRFAEICATGCPGLGRKSCLLPRNPLPKPPPQGANCRAAFLAGLLQRFAVTRARAARAQEVAEPPRFLSQVDRQLWCPAPGPWAPGDTVGPVSAVQRAPAPLRLSRRPSAGFLTGKAGSFQKARQIPAAKWTRCSLCVLKGRSFVFLRISAQGEGGD